ncbi:radical SAM domain protein [Candidatus Vecturithrix granuli]|uniref:Radical SAM domain protein n=1 Tax=Vecturithrix granuli TaxID=1499967 RepID=A0A0S6WA04_VECG1|nr:radical SAM domain protein [Candidatus Vecturithrix granuli]
MTQEQHVPFPTHLLIETTTRCNLRCKQCAHVIHKYDFADMQLETFYKLRPLFPTAEQVALYGHGETFLYPHFFEMLAELKQHDIFVYVTTNGTLITEDVARRLVELQLDRLAFSLDAATPELFNEIRRGADFEKVLSNIRTLNALKKQARRDDKPILSIMYCAMKSNIQELPKLVRLADELNMTHGVAVMNIYEYGLSGESLVEHPELAEGPINEANRLAQQLAVPLGGLENGFEGLRIALVQLSAWDRLYRNYREFKRSFDRKNLLKTKWSRLLDRLNRDNSLHQEETTTEIRNKQESGKTIRVKKCRDPWEFLFVDVHGNIRPCCTSHRIMGNLHAEDFMTIWNNPKYQEFRAKMVSPDIPEECKTCIRKAWQTIPYAPTL